MSKADVVIRHLKGLAAGEETGMTFAGCREDCNAFVDLMAGSGVRVEVISNARTREQTEEFKRSMASMDKGRWPQGNDQCGDPYPRGPQ